MPAPEGEPAAAPIAGSVGPGGLVAHPVWLAAGDKIEVVARRAGAPGSMLAMAYGPRDAFGGLPHCRALSTGGKVTITAAEAGEHLVLVGLEPGGDQADYTITTTCKKGCDAARCPTLAEQGCADARCDGELARDASGCLTCACDALALCGPDRAAGPGGTCLLPACTCEGPADPVCGADGNTWPSACHALCAAVPIARDEACSVACPALSACEAPCFGLRALGADGCPTCACLSEFADNAESCAACPEAAAPVCGSDGVSYRNRCAARCAGARVMLAGACPDDDVARAWPSGCAKDCAFGLRPVAGLASAFACECAPAPTLACPSEGAPVCATVPGPVGETTVASACVAVALGASGDASVWGPCGARCDEDVDCEGAASAPAACRTVDEGGFLAGRCLLTETPACGCARIVDPVCGRDLVTYDNACLAHCAGVAVLHAGPCCEAAPACAGGDPMVDWRGCVTACGEAPDGVCAPAEAIVAPACDAAGELVPGRACEAHATGLAAWPEACP
ncbi:MAG: hypothetical protein IT385_21045 [Deltaproteobacteria bacterium]|nr:hypothetical protein [Deltaproteobacteria bacterium]